MSQSYDVPAGSSSLLLLLLQRFSLGYVLLSTLALGCGPIGTPNGAVDLTVRPRRFRRPSTGRWGAHG